MSDPSTARFFAYLVFISGFFLSWLTDNQLLKYLGFLCLAGAVFVGPLRSQLHRRLIWKDLLVSLLCLLVAALAVFALGDYWNHPAVVISVWVISIAAACWRRFRGSRSTTGEPVSKIDSGGLS
jgi:NADH:ubiquinone oxidoreductase subunit K